MTPKQKACKLRYLISIALDLKTDDEKVLKCALIAVDELIKEVKYLTPDIRKRYYEEVKQEIVEL